MVKRQGVVAAIVGMALAACQPHAGEEAPDATASLLVGIEYMGIPLSDSVAEGVPCRFVSSGGVGKDGVELPGWVEGQILCNDRVPYVFLAKNIGQSKFAFSLGNPPGPYALRKIVAVQKLPPVSNFSDGGMDSDLFELVDSWAGQCDLDGQGGNSFVALVRWNGYEAVSGPPWIGAVWGFDVDAGRVVRINPERLRCEPMLMD